ncbi:TIM-barrel domain-containing protein [Lacticaseibacillus zhaodongensis]|uniref:TIM-barrel domain-containing protein n=1 Tax=Lacticaseibacillus zhaodongensis TaxID=2668065 RepID=UPI0018AFA89A|nr:TIM-barrel domain-containing protein [Lacticaseibacillus zhaodongensis]
MTDNPNQIRNLHLAAGQVYFDYNQWHARISGWSDRVFRLTVTAAETWPDHPSIPAAPKVEKHADQTVASGGSGQVFRAPIVLQNQDHPLTLAADTVQIGAYRLRVHDGLLTCTQDKQLIFEQSLPQLTDTSWSSMVRATPTSFYYGGGMQHGPVALNEKLTAIKNENRWTDGGVTSPVPFYWSTSGYGMLQNTFTPGEYDFSTPHRGVRLTHEDPVYDAYVILAAEPAQILHTYHELTGLPALPPRTAFYPAHLNAYNRDYWVEVTAGSAAAVRFEDGKYYKEYQPIKKETFNTEYRPGTITVGGVQLVPNVYGSGHVQFVDADGAGMPRSYRRESLNGPENYQFTARAVVDRYQRNQFPLGWLLPNDGYGAGYGQSDSFAGDLANLADFSKWAAVRGITTGLWTQQNVTPKDPQHPEKGERDLDAEIKTGGVKALKTDVAWVGEGYTFGLNATDQAATSLKQFGLRPLIISLDGWAGSQRDAIIWTGDQSGSNWQSMATHIASYLSAGLSGLPYVASDVDGIYAGSDYVIQTRDLQWKAFTPFFFAMDGWGERAKWLGMDAPEPLHSINRAYLQYHTTLLPYLYSLAAAARNSGAPIMRPSWWRDPDAYTHGNSLNEQFTLGDAFLLAPIMNPYGLQQDGGSLRDHVYLPHGDWYDFWTGTRINGGQTLSDLQTPISHLPIFVRAGSIIPRTNWSQNPSAFTQNRVIDYYPGPASATTLYEDAGSGLEYSQGACATTHIAAAMKSDQITMTIDPRQGTFAGAASKITTTINVYSSAKPVSVQVLVDGKEQAAQWQFGPAAADPLAEYRNCQPLRIDFQETNPNVASITVTINY